MKSKVFDILRVLQRSQDDKYQLKFNISFLK